MWATAVYRYYFPTIRWGPIGLNQLDTTVRRNLSKYQAHNRNASVTGLYIYRSNGGRGLTRVGASSDWYGGIPMPPVGALVERGPATQHVEMC